MNPDITARRNWASQQLERCTEPVPTYGSTLFNALNNTDIRRVASVVRAAECWAIDGDTLVERLKLEVDLAAQLYKQQEDARYAADVVEHADRWQHLSVVRGAYADTEDFLRGTGWAGGRR